MGRVPGTYRKTGQQWTSVLECLSCGQNYTHVEVSPDASDAPDHDVPVPCDECGGELVRVSVERRVIRYEPGSRLDRLR